MISWPFRKPVIRKNTMKFWTNTFCFYSFNRKGTINTYTNSKQESVSDFLREIKYKNPFNHNLMIMDNFSAHRTENVAVTAVLLDIELFFLPPYLPQLNTIELIWKSKKKVVLRTFMKD